MRLRYGFSAAIGRYHSFGADCTGRESRTSQCVTTGSVCVADSAPHAIAIQCVRGELTSIILAAIACDLPWCIKNDPGNIHYKAEHILAVVYI